MRQYSNSPQRQRTQRSHRRVGSTIPSVGLPSCYPAGSTMIVTGQKTVDGDTHNIRTDGDSLMMMMMMRLNHNDGSMSSLDDSFPPQREGSTELRQPPQSTPPRPTPSKSERRQRNRAYTDEDFAAIMNEYSANIL